jgi:hypothetical protein
VKILLEKQLKIDQKIKELNDVKHKINALIEEVRETNC